MANPLPSSSSSSTSSSPSNNHDTVPSSPVLAGTPTVVDTVGSSSISSVLSTERIYTHIMDWATAENEVPQKVFEGILTIRSPPSSSASKTITNDPLSPFHEPSLVSGVSSSSSSSSSFSAVTGTSATRTTTTRSSLSSSNDSASGTGSASHKYRPLDLCKFYYCWMRKVRKPVIFLSPIRIPLRRKGSSRRGRTTSSTIENGVSATTTTTTPSSSSVGSVHSQGSIFIDAAKYANIAYHTATTTPPDNTSSNIIRIYPETTSTIQYYQNELYIIDKESQFILILGYPSVHDYVLKNNTKLDSWQRIGKRILLEWIRFWEILADKQKLLGERHAQQQHPSEPNSGNGTKTNDKELIEVNDENNEPLIDEDTTDIQHHDGTLDTTDEGSSATADNTTTSKPNTSGKFISRKTLSSVATPLSPLVYTKDKDYVEAIEAIPLSASTETDDGSSFSSSVLSFPTFVRPTLCMDDTSGRFVGTTIPFTPSMLTAFALHPGSDDMGDHDRSERTDETKPSSSGPVQASSGAGKSSNFHNIEEFVHFQMKTNDKWSGGGGGGGEGTNNGGTAATTSLFSMSNASSVTLQTSSSSGSRNKPHSNRHGGSNTVRSSMNNPGGGKNTGNYDAANNYKNEGTERFGAVARIDNGTSSSNTTYAVPVMYTNPANSTPHPPNNHHHHPYSTSTPSSTTSSSYYATLPYPITYTSPVIYQGSNGSHPSSSTPTNVAYVYPSYPSPTSVNTTTTAIGNNGSTMMVMNPPNTNNNNNGSVRNAVTTVPSYFIDNSSGTPIMYMNPITNNTSTATTNGYTIVSPTSTSSSSGYDYYMVPSPVHQQPSPSGLSPDNTNVTTSAHTTVYPTTTTMMNTVHGVVSSSAAQASFIYVTGGNNYYVPVTGPIHNNNSSSSSSSSSNSSNNNGSSAPTVMYRYAPSSIMYTNGGTTTNHPGNAFVPHYGNHYSSVGTMVDNGTYQGSYTAETGGSNGGGGGNTTASSTFSSHNVVYTGNGNYVPYAHPSSTTAPTYYYVTTPVPGTYDGSSSSSSSSASTSTVPAVPLTGTVDNNNQ